MRIAIAGAHGQVARRLGRLLSGRGDTVVGIVRNPAHEPDLVADGVEPASSTSRPPRWTRSPRWCAAPTPWSSPPAPGRAAARSASTPSTAAPPCCSPTRPSGRVCGMYLLVSSMGVEQARKGTPRGMDPVFAAYLQAKLRAEDEILPRPGLDTTIVRPGRLTDEPGTGRVTLGHGIELGDVPAGRRRRRPRRDPARRQDQRRGRAGRRADADRGGGRRRSREAQAPARPGDQRAGAPARRPRDSPPAPA